MVAIAVAWAAGTGVEALTGFPGAVAGLVLLAAALVARPRALEVVGPVGDVVVRWLPLLLVPPVVAVGALRGGADVGAIVAGVVVSVPAGFLVAARLARPGRP